MPDSSSAKAMRGGTQAVGGFATGDRVGLDAIVVRAVGRTVTLQLLDGQALYIDDRFVKSVSTCPPLATGGLAGKSPPRAKPVKEGHGAK